MTRKPERDPSVEPFRWRYGAFPHPILKRLNARAQDSFCAIFLTFMTYPRGFFDLGRIEGRRRHPKRKAERTGPALVSAITCGRWSRAGRTPGQTGPFG